MSTSKKNIVTLLVIEIIVIVAAIVTVIYGARIMNPITMILASVVGGMLIADLAWGMKTYGYIVFAPKVVEEPVSDNAHYEHDHDEDNDDIDPV